MEVMNFATHDVVTVAPSDSIDKAISLMEERDFHHLVVTMGREVIGMVSDRDILISTGWMLSVERQAQGKQDAKGRVVGPVFVHQIMSRPVVCLEANHTARDAALIMLDHKISAVPVLKHDRLVGLVTETDLMDWLNELAVDDVPPDSLVNGEVRALMRAKVLTVAPEVLLERVIHLLRYRRIRHVPVEVQGKLVGIISDRDVRRALGWAGVRDAQAEIEGRLIENETPRTAGEIMHTAMWTVDPFDSVREALHQMVHARIHSLPVVDGQLLRGIITQTDLVRVIAREHLL